jgi:hypothetical protein
MGRGGYEKEATMCTQKTLIYLLISGLIAFAAESVAIADVVMMPNTQATGLFGPDRDAVPRERLACTQPIPHQIREDLASGAQDTRAYLDSARLTRVGTCRPRR